MAVVSSTVWLPNIREVMQQWDYDNYRLAGGTKWHYRRLAHITEDAVDQLEEQFVARIEREVAAMHGQFTQGAR